MALLWAGGVGGEQQERSSWLRVQAQLRACVGAGDRVEAVEVHAAGQYLHARGAAGCPGPLAHCGLASTGQLFGQRGGDRCDDIHALEHRAGEQARAGMADVGAMDRKSVHPRANREGRQGGEAEMSVDDVEVAPCRALRGEAAQVKGRARQGRPARRELIELDVQFVQAAQRGDLVAHKLPALGMAGIGEHVGYHQRPQHPLTVALWNDGLRGARVRPSIIRASLHDPRIGFRMSPFTDQDPRARPIAVFDSGVGGLTVLHELLVRLPREDFVYLGDTARFPYGQREPHEIERFAAEIAEELLHRGAKLLVVACNSATSAALGSLSARMRQTTLGIDVMGVVRPEALRAVAATRSGRIGLLATPTTVASGAYERAIAAVDPHVALHAVPCPTLASIIQAGEQFDEQAVATVRAACEPLRAAGVDTVILGCTHYPLISPMLQRTLGPDVKLVTSGAALARQVEHALSTRELRNPRTDADGEGEYRFLCTGDVDAFREVGTHFLQMPLGAVEHVELATVEAIA